MNYETENFHDQEITFTYEGQDYLWIGDYTIEHFGEDESEFAPAYGEMEITIDYTRSLYKPNGKITKYSKPNPRTSQVSRYGRAHL